MAAVTSPAPSDLERVSGEVVGGPQMSAEEARRRTDAVKRQAREMMRELRALYEGEAHVALGYSSWGDYFNAEFRQVEPSQRIDPKSGYKALRAAEQEAVLSVHADTHGMSMAQAGVFCKVKPLEEKLALVAWVEERGGWREVSARAMERRLREHRGEVIPVPDGLGEDAWNGLLADRMRDALGHVFDALHRLRSARRRRIGHYVLPEAMRALSRDDALTVQARIAEERTHLAEVRAVIDATEEHLAQAAYLLDQRGDLPPTPEPPRRDQLTVEEVIAEVEV